MSKARKDQRRLRVTERLDSSATAKLPAAGPVTAQFGAAARRDTGATDRFDRSATNTASAGLKADALVADRYRVEAGPLGAAAANSEVYRCHDEQLGEAVAVKLYPLKASAKPGVLDQLRGLAHPNIVSVKDYGRWEGHAVPLARR